MWDHFSICQQCPPKPVDRKQFQPADHVLVQHIRPLGGNQTHDLRLTIVEPFGQWKIRVFQLSLKVDVGWVFGESGTTLCPLCCCCHYVVVYYM